ncbi:hypothetical protein ACFX12_024840 [Malus domestica]
MPTTCSTTYLHDRFSQSITLYAQMQRVGVLPSGFTFSSVLNACARVLAVFEGKQVHTRVVQCGFLGNKIVQTALLHMGLMGKARRLFDIVGQRNVASWTTMVAGYTKNGGEKFSGVGGYDSGIREAW